MRHEMAESRSEMRQAFARQETELKNVRDGFENLQATVELQITEIKSYEHQGWQLWVSGLLGFLGFGYLVGSLGFSKACIFGFLLYFLSVL
jgi:hypothetical protein